MAATRSFTKTRGRGVTAASSSSSGVSRNGRFAAYRTVPLSASTSPAMQRPHAVVSEFATTRASWSTSPSRLFATLSRSTRSTSPPAMRADLTELPPTSTAKNGLPRKRYFAQPYRMIRVEPAGAGER